MIDKSKIGYEFESFTTTVEAGKLRFFAKATGQADAIYVDESAASEASYSHLPAPPSFPFVLDMDAPRLFPYVDVLGIDMNRVLHGAQDFEYFVAIEAGDKIEVRSKISDIYDKKNGALEFIVIDNQYRNQRGELAATATTTIVYRNV